MTRTRTTVSEWKPTGMMKCVADLLQTSTATLTERDVRAAFPLAKPAITSEALRHLRTEGFVSYSVTSRQRKWRRSGPITVLRPYPVEALS